MTSTRTVRASTSTLLGTFLRPPNRKVILRFWRHWAAMATCRQKSQHQIDIKYCILWCFNIEILIEKILGKVLVKKYAKRMEIVSNLDEVSDCRKRFVREIWRDTVSECQYNQSRPSLYTSFSILAVYFLWKVQNTSHKQTNKYRFGMEKC